MPTCKDCVHVDVCREYAKDNLTSLAMSPAEIQMALTAAENKPCDRFKDRSKFIELPCKVGDFLYQPHRNQISKYRIKNFKVCMYNYLIIEWEIYSGIAYKLNGVYADEIGRTVFLTQEEAEQALKEREENG